jgi:hypothetical protein
MLIRSSARQSVLLTIISRIRKYSRIETAPNPVVAVDNNAMRVGLQEIVIKNDRPLGIIYFSMTVRHESTIGSLPTNVLVGEGLEGVWELSIK